MESEERGGGACVRAGGENVHHPSEVRTFSNVHFNDTV